MRSASWPHAPGNVGGRRGLSWVERGVREARIPGPVCAHACAALGKLASACGVCGLDFVRKKKNHEGVWRYLGWTFSFFFFFLFLLGYKHPEEVNLHERMTSFPLFLNNAPSHQQEAYPARRSGLREWKVLEARTAAQAFPGSARHRLRLPTPSPARLPP